MWENFPEVENRRSRYSQPAPKPLPASEDAITDHAEIAELLRLTTRRMNF